MLTDLRHATRALLRAPGFTATAVLTLAIGIGGTTAMFTIVNHVVLNPLPFNDANRLVLLWGSKPHEGQPEIPFSQPDFEDLRARVQAFDAIGAWAIGRGTISGGDPEQVQWAVVTASLFASFAIVAVILAMVGVYALLAYTVAQRTLELGIRLALGGQPHDLLSMILKDGARPLVAGIALGVPAAIGAGTMLRTLLFGVAPADVTTIGGAIAVMLAVGMAACYVPARRATQVDPLSALRTE